MLIDTHAHVNSPEFEDDWRAALDRACASGVDRVICVGYDVPTSERAVSLAQQDPRVYATVGLHPNSVAEAPIRWELALERLADQPRVVAIGETGLDYYRDWTSHHQQRSALRWHLDLAEGPVSGRHPQSRFGRGRDARTSRLGETEDVARSARGPAFVLRVASHAPFVRRCRIRYFLLRHDYVCQQVAGLPGTVGGWRRRRTSCWSRRIRHTWRPSRFAGGAMSLRTCVQSRSGWLPFARRP